jgi:hypothetical protein
MMKLFGVTLGKTKGSKDVEPGAQPKAKMNFDVKHQVQELTAKAERFQITIITLAVVGLLAITALRMMHYADPAADDTRVQENLSKFKQIHIDQKTVQKIKSLKDSQTSTSPNIEGNRSNPFSE